MEFVAFLAALKSNGLAPGLSNGLASGLQISSVVFDVDDIDNDEV